MAPPLPSSCRQLVIILGDQLNLDSAALADFDPKRDCVWMAEVAEESEHVWNHMARIAVFLAAMRHFAETLAEQGYPLLYRRLDEKQNRGTLTDELRSAVERLQPSRLILVQPGCYRLQQAFQELSAELEVPLELRDDQHFLVTAEEFAEHASGRKQLRMEFFYREQRRRYDVLMDGRDPEGGRWNFDAENRGRFGRKGPGKIRPPRAFSPDAITAEVLQLVERRFAEHPGELSEFDWPVTPEDAARALEDFIKYRLPDFGRYQDAMWSDEPYLYHSRLSVALNLKLLDPRTVLSAAEDAYRSGKVPLASAEGFIRQILGWREYVRGVYWRFMPKYLERNAMQAEQPLPAFYWTGETDMHCLQQSIRQTLRYGYAHHIQRLMVTGLFSLLLGVDPREVHAWYLAVYVDAVEWVELPNTLGMSQFADGGVMASKPYVATGKYIQRMSNYCGDCCFDPSQSTGDQACPFTTLYWDYLDRHRDVLRKNNRMSMQLKNLERKDAEDLQAIREQAQRLRTQWESSRSK